MAFTIAVTLSAAVHLKDAAFGALVAAFPNTGFMGVPLLVALLGKAAAGPVICSDAGRPVRHQFAVHRAGAGPRGRRATGAGARAAADRAERARWSNPLPWAIALGALSRSLGWQARPAPVATHRATCSPTPPRPVALFTIGAVLWRAGQHAHTRTPPSLYLPVAAIKLFVHPLLVFALCAAARALGAPISTFEVTVLTLAAALPSASNVSLLAERYGADNGRIARIILASTALAFVSFTLLAWALGVGGALNGVAAQRPDFTSRQAPALCAPCSGQLPASH